MKYIEMLETERVVTSEKGSWKWQNAYRISSYRARKAENGKIVWHCYHTSGKYSEPQLRACGLDRLTAGGLHNKQVDRNYAISIIGRKAVRALEARGWRFKHD